MCEGVAYVVDGGERKVMEEVMSLQARDGVVTLVNEDGETKIVEGVREIRVNLVTHEVRLLLG